MNTTFHLVFFSIIVLSVSTAPSQSAFSDFANALDATLDGAREKREQNEAPANIRAIFAKAKAEEEDGNVNFCGFYVGMDSVDADALISHYDIKYTGAYIIGNPVYDIKLSLKSVQRITKGGNSYDELCQAVANRVGNLKQKYGNSWRSWYEYKTIDGVRLTMSEEPFLSEDIEAGFHLWDSTGRLKAEAKRKADAEKQKAAEAERKAAEERAVIEHRAFEKRRKEAEAKIPQRIANPPPEMKKAVEQICDDMMKIPGKDYRMGKYEVTQGQWEAVMGWPCEIRNSEKRYIKSGDNLPVVNVSCDDCQEFVKVLNSLQDVKRLDFKFRLPTNEEWVYACSAGTTHGLCKLEDETIIDTKFELSKVAWYDDNSGLELHPVGQKMPNAFGLYDMLGNVSEWCQEEISEVQKVGSNVIKHERIDRGGSFRDHDFMFFSSLIFSTPSDDRRCTLGFRLCATVSNENARLNLEQEKIRAESQEAEASISELIEQMVPIPGKEFMMGKYEVTHGQWLAVKKFKPEHSRLLDNPDSSLPVTKVTYNDCQSFLFALNHNPLVKRSGMVFRLPSQEEWEYAGRAGGRGKYGTLENGEDVALLNEVAWYRTNSEGTVHPVGQKRPNGYGLYDMIGNVSEWTEMGTGFFDGPKARGGGYDSSDSGCEVSMSMKLGVDDWSDELGFRLCANTMPGRAASVEAILAGMVAIPGQDYLMGKYEVTQGQWEAVTGKNPSKVQSADKPANYVSWDDCQEFIQMLNTNSAVVAAGLVFRLPWAEEWEYACKAGAKGKYCRMKGGKEVKESNLEEVAWFEKNAQKKTFPVGEKMPNDFGLYDMLGNVSEWCQEHQSEIREVESTENGNEQLRVACGGNLFDSAIKCEAGQKRSIRSSARNSAIGFRLCAEKR